MADLEVTERWFTLHLPRNWLDKPVTPRLKRGCHEKLMLISPFIKDSKQEIAPRLSRSNTKYF